MVHDLGEDGDGPLVDGVLDVQGRLDTMQTHRDTQRHTETVNR